jgi:hypothetical protein
MNDTDQPSLAVIETNPPQSDSQLQTNNLATTQKRPRTARPIPQRAIDLSTTPIEDRHCRKCHVCNHPDRDLIELDFLNWRSSRAISIDHQIPENSIYRHAHALGLFDLRRANMRLALDRVIEKCSYAEATADTVVRAVRAQACLTDDNHWVEPARHLIVTSQPAAMLVTSQVAIATSELNTPSTDSPQRGLLVTSHSPLATDFLIESAPIRNEV